PDPGGDIQHLAAGYHDRGRQRLDFDAWHTADLDHVAMFHRVAVHHLECVAVLDSIVVQYPVERVPVVQHVHGEGLAGGDGEQHGRGDRHQPQAVDHHARTQEAGLAAVEGIVRGVADQPARVADCVHDLIAGIDAGATGDGLVLQAVADVGAGRADLHAHGAVDTLAQALEPEVLAPAARPARLAAL